MLKESKGKQGKKGTVIGKVLDIGARAVFRFLGEVSIRVMIPFESSSY